MSGSESTRIITIQTLTPPSEERRGRGAGMGVRGLGGSRQRGYRYVYGGFMLLYGRNHHNIVKQLSSNLKKKTTQPEASFILHPFPVPPQASHCPQRRIQSHPQWPPRPYRMRSEASQTSPPPPPPLIPCMPPVTLPEIHPAARSLLHTFIPNVLSA